MNIILIALMFCAFEVLAVTPDAVPVKTVPAAAAPEIPLGVYWPGEFTFQEYQIPKIRWKHIDAALDDMATHNINTIWLTHLDSATTAEFSRHGAKRGISVVASIAELAGDVEHIRRGDHKTLVANTLKAWGDAPRPVAWGLGDEPRAEYMGEMAAYANDWNTYAPGEPLTTTVMWNDILAASTLPFDMLASDIYPFFSVGNPNNYGMPEYLAWTKITDNLVAKSRRAWMMGQAYQEPWGPYELDEKGNIVYLPGGAPHWVMPTPAQMKWQAWSTVACGAKGMFYFLYRWPTVSSPKAEPARLPAAVKERTNSNSPKGLVYDDGRSTPQFDAVGVAFGQIGKLMPILAPLKPLAAQEGWLQSGSPSAVVRMLVNPKTDKRYLVVVGPYDGDSGVRVTVGPHITGLKNLATGALVPLNVAVPFRSALIQTTPGDGQVFECAVDVTAMPKCYVDNFTTEKFKTDAINGGDTKAKWFEGGAGSFLSAAGGNMGADQAFLIYDLDKLLGPIEPGGVRMLIYDGCANPVAYRGAFWSVSKDGTTYRSLSENDFGKAVLFSDRYLKVGVSWMGSTAAAFYGKLSSFTVAQWAKPAK